MKRAALLAFLILSCVAPAGAVQPDEMLKDPALEARARDLGRQLRCPVCQGESIEESNAEFTSDLRRLVRERIAAGDTDRQVLDYLYSRYGDFILLKPRFSPTNWALWLTPPAVLVFGGVMAFVMMRRRRVVETPPLSDAERKALEALR